MKKLSIFSALFIGALAFAQGITFEDTNFSAILAKAKKENSVILSKNKKWIAPGHNSVVTDDKGQEWIVYHAIDSNNPKSGRIVLIDKITYKNGRKYKYIGH